MNTNDAKKRQRDFHNAHARTVHCGDAPFSGLTRIGTFLAQRPLQTALELLGESVKGRAVLCICAGNGDEALFLHTRGAHVTATDISEETCALIARRNPALATLVADAEHLPFPDGHFDFVVVKHGLHHLPRPILGLYEMLRVARRGILVMEAHDSWMMRTGIAARLIPAVEESGNFVYRFSRHEMKKLFHTLFLDDITIRTEWYQFIQPLEQYIFPLMNHRVGFLFFRVIFRVVNACIGRWGNNFIMVVKKERAL